MNKAIYFDMDGTLADLYGTENWLDKLRSYDASPFAEAEVKLNMQALAHRLNRLQRHGYTIGVISWLSKETTKEYDKEVIKAKTEWLARHLGSVKFDEIHLVKFGKRKSKVAKVKNGILFDDNAKVRKEWIRHNPSGWAFAEKDILAILDDLSNAYPSFT